MAKKPATTDEDTKPARTTAAMRLRAFEDGRLGKDAVRIDGMVERGVGSPFARMSDDDKRKHAAIERFVEAEQKLDDARDALVAAEQAHQAAEAEANG